MRERTEWKECIRSVRDEWEREENGGLTLKEKDRISTSTSNLTKGSWTYTASAYGGCIAGVNPPPLTRSRSHTWGWCLCTLQLHAIIYHLLLSCTGVLSMALRSPQQQWINYFILVHFQILLNFIWCHFASPLSNKRAHEIAPLSSSVNLIRVYILSWYLRLAQKRLFLKPSPKEIRYHQF